MNSSTPYKRVAVIVVTYNGSRWVHPCMRSLKASAYPVTIIVVDNHSSDNTPALIEEFYPEVRLIRSKENLGFGKANNLALAHALEEGMDYFFLLNQDAWVSENTIGELIKAFEKDEDRSYGIISPLHFDGSGVKIDAGFDQYLRSAGYTTAEMISAATEAVFAVPFINAAAWMVSLQCLERVGGFGYLFSHYGEDRDYLQRLKYSGMKMGFITKCKIFHDREGRTFNLADFRKLTWYYFTGAMVRSADINKPYVFALMHVNWWLVKELAYHFFRGHLHALPSYFAVMIKLISSFGTIRGYRIRIQENVAFRFLK
jgi:N-acetylglucosaminyl-diphospho-decaprenol L-rhamnosyltransferase